MLLKLGVDISRLEYHTRKALSIVSRVYREVIGEELVITSTYEGTHSEASLHYQNRAFDIRLPKSNTAEVVKALKEALGSDFDVVLEGDHIHIEYDPKEERR